MGVVVKVVCLGCHPPVCGLGRGGGVVLTFLRVGAILTLYVSIAAFSVGSGKYRCFSHPNWFLVDVELYREDWGIFVFRVCSIECVGLQPVVYVLVEFFGSESF